MNKKLSSLCLRIAPEFHQELTQEAEQQKALLSDYVRGILARRKLVSQAAPGLDELQTKLESLQARLEKANKELKAYGLSAY